jgi:hypothetical protein
MPLTSLTCPICLGTLKPKTAVHEGTRIRCPNCKGSFVAEAEPKAPPEPVHEPILTETQEPMPEPIAAAEEIVEAEEAAEAPMEEIAEQPSRPRPRASREDDDYDRPRRRRARRDDDDEQEEESEDRFRRKPKKGVPVWVWLVSGGVGLVLLLGCCGVGGIVVWSAAGGGGPVSVNNYNQLKKGMSPAQVQAILGPPTTTLQFGFSQTETWQNGTDNITVGFLNGTAATRSCNIQHNGWIQLQDSGILPW